MNNISKRLLLAFATVEVVFIGILVGYTILSNKTIEERKLVQTNTQIPSPTPETSNEGLRYANIEEDLMIKKYFNNNPTSLIFSLQVMPFNKDWMCTSYGYNEKGYEIDCQQKSCTALINAPGFGKKILDSDQQQNCNIEYRKRDFPQSLFQVRISASEFETENEITDFSTVIKPEKLKKTPTGRVYEFSSVSKGEYENSYFATFYSPFELTNRLSNLGGTFYGADWIYGKYVISTDVKGENIEDKVNRLFVQIIDSIKFIESDDVY